MPYPPSRDPLPGPIQITSLTWGIPGRTRHNTGVTLIAGPVPFVGRDDELDLLAGAFDRAAAGGAELVLVTGDPGVGKSRLVAETCARLDGQARTAVGGCVDIPGIEDAQLPFGPFVEALRQLRREVDAGTRQALDAWLDPGSGPDRSDHDPVHTRFADLLPVLDRLTADRPLVLVLEDLHWADRSSLALLIFLTRNLTREPVLLVATARSHSAPEHGVHATVDHLVRLPGVSALRMNPLPTDRILQIVHDSAPVPIPDEVAAGIAARAEGNPLAATELAVHRQRSGAGNGLPPTLAASVRDRIRRGSEPARTALAAAAVLGGTAGAGVLDRMLAAALPGLDAADRAGAVHEAAATGLLVATGDGYRFRHGLDREVVYTELWPEQRQRLHAEAAAALTASAPGATDGAADEPVLSPDLAARLAAHWQSAGDPAAARAASLVAARASVQLSAFPEALTHFENALAQWPVSLSTFELRGGPGHDLLMEAADTAFWASRLDRGLELLQHAVGAATTPEQAGHAWERMAWFRHESGDGAGASAAYDQALASIGDDRNSATAARVLATHAVSLMLAGRYQAATERALEALAAADASGAAAAEASARITLGFITAVTGDPESGLEQIGHGSTLAAEQGDEEQFWRAQVNVGYVLHYLGRYRDAADGVLVALEDLPVDSPVPPHAMIALGNAAEALTLTGRWPEADRLLDDGLARRPNPYETVGLIGYQARLRLLLGDRTDAARLLDQVRTRSAGLTDPDLHVDIHLLAAELALDAGDLTAAREAVDAALAALEDVEEDQPQFPVLTVAARIEAEAGQVPGLGDPDRVQRFRDLVGQLVGRTTELQAHARLEGAFCQAELARVDGVDDRAAWRLATEQAELLERPYDKAYALFRLGEAEVRARRRDQAGRALADAHRIATGLGAAALAERVEQTARRVRVTLDPPDAGAAPARPAGGAPARAAGLGLTAREAEVLRLLLEGRTNRLIGSSLGMSEKTASVHVSRILAKLGVTTRGEAAAAAQRLRLLED
jgi:DNA-binding CsgD family transcriptional regulator/tetratricopeptide (TPR) repeat protein